MEGGHIATDSGARHATLDLRQSLAYVEKVFRDYLLYAGLPGFSGVVCEIGPGDSFGVALLMLKSGAREVHAVDRYRPRRDPERQRVIYKALIERFDLEALFDEVVDEASIRGLHYHPGQPAETFFRGGGLTFDAIVSRAVLEHLYDPIKALDDMVLSLRPGGVLIHRIDLRDHGMFSPCHHPLTLLTVPDSIYRRMTRASGRPNRVLLPAYREWLARDSITGTLRITRLVGVDEEVGPAEWEQLDPGLRRLACRRVAEIRPALLRSFAGMSDKELAICGCVLVARKPAIITLT